jgi:hypothetical protein
MSLLGAEDDRAVRCLVRTQFRYFAAGSPLAAPLVILKSIHVDVYSADRASKRLADIGRIRGRPSP